MTNQTKRPLNRLRAAIEAVMNDAPTANPSLAVILEGIAALYGMVIQQRIRLFRRGRLPSHRLPCKVLSIGNITMGGTGKTPMSLYIAEMIHAAGYRAAIVSRGYKGAAEKEGGIVSDGAKLQMTSSAAGDEPLLLATKLRPLGIPVIVGQDRVRSGALAVKRFQAEVIILDDGFQHMRLQRDLDLVLLDARRPFGNGYILPRGTLREPVRSLARADICILTRCSRAMVADHDRSGIKGILGPAINPHRQPVFAASHTPLLSEVIRPPSTNERIAGVDLKGWTGYPVYAVSGIARNDAFHSTLQQLGFDLRGWTAFCDHHRYARTDLAAIESAARQVGAQLLITTEKDRMKIDDRWITTLPMLVLGVQMDLGVYRDAFEQLVMRRLGMGKTAIA